MKTTIKTKKNENLLAQMNEEQLLKELNSIKEDDPYKKNKEQVLNTYLKHARHNK